MTFGEKLKAVRKEAGMSQEELAEKLGVSRQAVTKWETEKGSPDIENIITISNLFGISVDEFLSHEKEAAVRKGYLYESKTEYDIDGKKRFDLKLGGAASLRVSQTKGEKIAVCLCSNGITSIEKDFKVKIDDIKGRIDVTIKRQNQMTEAQAKEGLFIDVALPKDYLSKVELESNCKELLINELHCEKIEFGGRANSIKINSVSGNMEIDCNMDMDICVTDFSGLLAINQVSATSRLALPEDFSFRCAKKGISTSVSYEVDGKAVDDFSDPAGENIIEFNGIKSELVIFKEK